MRTLSVWVPGTPIPQGSKRALLRKGSNVPIVVDANRIGLADWRAQMSAHIREAWAQPPEVVGTFAVRAEFVFRRPNAHYLPPNSKRVYPHLREGAPKYVGKAPDLDKLVRALLDAMTDAGVWHDDEQVVYLAATKRYVTENPAQDRPGPGVYIQAGLWGN